MEWAVCGKAQRTERKESSSTYQMNKVNERRINSTLGLPGSVVFLCGLSAFHSNHHQIRWIWLFAVFALHICVFSDTNCTGTHHELFVWCVLSTFNYLVQICVSNFGVCVRFSPLFWSFAFRFNLVGVPTIRYVEYAPSPHRQGERERESLIEYVRSSTECTTQPVVYFIYFWFN